MNLLRGPDEDGDQFGPVPEDYLWLTRLIICAVLIIGGLQILGAAAAVYFGGFL